MPDATTDDAVSSGIQVIYEYPGAKPRFPYLLLQAGPASFYKVLLRGSFLFIGHGRKLIDRGQGELDIPHAGAQWRPIGDFVYAHPSEAQAAFARFRASPGEMLTRVLTGRKP
jgi:hypothetical protein